MEAARKGKEELVGEVNYLKTLQVSCLSCRVQNPCRTGPKMLFFSLKEKAPNRYISNTFLTCKFGYSKAAYPMWIYSPDVNFVRTCLLDLFLQVLWGVERLVPDINIIMQCEWELSPLKIALWHCKKKAEEHILSYIVHYRADAKPRNKFTSRDRQTFGPSAIIYKRLTKLKLLYLEHWCSCGVCIQKMMLQTWGGGRGTCYNTKGIKASFTLKILNQLPQKAFPLILEY